MEKKQAVPYRRYNKEVSHKRGLQGWYSGRYPVKAAGEILAVLDGLEANAESKGLDLERLRLIHAVAQRARVLKRYIPRAFGRSSPNFENLCHIELVAEETR
jgi:large subunit ribosomal protein L22